MPSNWHAPLLQAADVADGLLEGKVGLQIQLKSCESALHATHTALAVAQQQLSGAHEAAARADAAVAAARTDGEATQVRTQTPSATLGRLGASECGIPGMCSFGVSI